MTRDNITQEVLDLSNKHSNLLLECATGVGKSRIALEVMQLHKCSKVLLCVAEIVHKNNWYEQFKLWKIPTPKEFTCITYASLKNYGGTSWDMVILDECHHTNTDIRSALLNSIASDRVLALSATVNKDVVETLEVAFGRFCVYKYNLRAAIKDNVLPSPSIKVVPLSLNSIDPNQIWIEHWGLAKNRKTIECSFAERWKYMSKAYRADNPSVTLRIHCTEQQYYDFIGEKYEYYRKQYFIFPDKEYLKNIWLQWGIKRKVYLGTLKTHVVRQLALSLGRKRFLCFCTNIDQEKTIAGGNYINSTRRDNEDIIRKFNQGDINSLYAVNMLREGQNLKNIEIGIMTQLDGNTLSFIQKLGRILRAENPLVYIFCYKGTRDEEYLNKALENIDKEYVEYEYGDYIK